MRNSVSRLILLVILLSASFAGYTAADIEINTPAIAALKQSMQQRHGQLEPYYARGAVGLTRDGLIAMRDANALPLSARQPVNALIASENQDRNALYREIARANNHPEWEGDIRSTFGQRWIELARPGWWYEGAGGAWVRK
ncbi:YdbL family protein [Nitrosospira sp. NpAV]|uniref:YdbL family protein n=1 Tax=Nitrosospira sp. NpAV TaxID=58133 RepID=UPI0005A292A4|nr:YdbL family protein [Nitrosospira sp. NpAV]KIO50035.1 cellobiose phosphorylase [Nitrosospira sp. NpAV]